MTAVIDVRPVGLDGIRGMRERYRQEMRCQIVHDSLHARGFTQAYLVRVDGGVAGYGCVLGFGGGPKDIVKEFYICAPHRAAALPAFRAFIEASGARTIEAQTNDPLLSLLLFDVATDVRADAILFHDALTTSLCVPGAVFRAVTGPDRARLFEHTGEPPGEWLIEVDGAIVATGGVLVHYNPPYGDIHMEVAEPFRRRGYGSLLVQELKRVAYESGRVPAARCSPSNAGSRASLEKAGMLPCARILRGVIPCRAS